MPTPRITLIGNLTADPELRFLQSGQSMVKFRVATQDHKRGSDGKWEESDSHFQNVVAFGPLPSQQSSRGGSGLAENIAESLVKGDAVIVVGRLVTREYTDKEGAKRSVTDVLADAVGPSLTFRSTPHGARARQAETQPEAQRSSTTAVGGQPDPWAANEPPY